MSESYTREAAYRDLLAWIVSDGVMPGRLRRSLPADLSTFTLATRLAIMSLGDHRDVWVYDEVVEYISGSTFAARVDAMARRGAL